MKNLELHNDCKLLSAYVYKKNKCKEINNWKCLNSCYSKNGFYCEIYKKENDLIIVFKGTDKDYGKLETVKDLYSDICMGCHLLPNQLKNARRVYNDYRRIYPNANIFFTGHSLGGSIAQALGAETGVKTITFSAYGIGHTYSPTFKYTNNIINYGNAQDAIFVSNIDAQLGKTIILNANTNSNSVIRERKPHYFNNLNPHYIENLGDLSKGIEYKRAVFENDNIPLFKLGIEYNDYNLEEIFDTKNRVLYRGEINPNDLEVGTSLYNLYIDNIISKTPMPTKKELDKRTRIGELIYVDDYIRSDGTKVSGYYRAYPEK